LSIPVSEVAGRFAIDRFTVGAAARLCSILSARSAANVAGGIDTRDPPFACRRMSDIAAFTALADP
jgi:hypothetical protein